MKHVWEDHGVSKIRCTPLIGRKQELSAAAGFPVTRK